MNSKIFSGILEHRNPICETCGVHCFSIYEGGRKDRGEDADQYEFIEETQSKEETKTVQENVEAQQQTKAEDANTKQTKK